MHLVLDVGNTETVLGLFEPGRRDLEAHWRVSTNVPRTPDEYVLLFRSLLRSSGYDPDTLTRVVLGSVVPSASDVLKTALARLGGGNPIVIEPGTPLPITLDVEEPMTVGADRIVNTLAASQLFGRDCVVVDLGTATTYDCITAGGVFRGGVIAPGILSGKEWLAARTAKLPPVEFMPPDQVIGRRTETCLHSGIFYAAMDAVSGMVGRIRGEWETSDLLVVGTGGFSSMVAAHVDAFDRVEPFLTLVGLELAGEHVAEAV